MNIEITKDTADGLTRRTWRFGTDLTGFYSIDFNINTCCCFEYTRKTKRHGWRVQRQWDRLMPRSNNMDAGDIPWPDGLDKEVLDKFVSTIKVVRP